VSPKAPIVRSMASWFALVISAGALLVAVLSYRRDRKASREAATSADRAAARADEAVEAQKRMAGALEAQSSPPAAAWCLEHFQGDSYLLTNSGSASAYQVHLDLGDIRIVRGELDSALLRAGDAHKFMAARAMGTANDTVTVSWLDSPTSPQRHRWARPLPPRPPR
jgi:ABC-type protease/lipase transport system fused ATPase/permease subunit